MKFKLLITAISFIPVMVMAQAPVIAPPAAAGTPGANGGPVAKPPAAVPVAVKAAPVPAGCGVKWVPACTPRAVGKP